jgi:hypothetical protein
MDWRKLFSRSDAAAAANASDVTNTNGALFGGGGIPDVVGTPAATDGPDLRLSEEVKRRQVALLVRYVMAMRVR